MAVSQPFEYYLRVAEEGPERRKKWREQFGAGWNDTMHVNPHCDDRVLHSPDDGCEVCDLFPEAQVLRIQWNINFTGENDLSKLPCPAEARRDPGTINKWPGNRVHKDGRPTLLSLAPVRPLTRADIAEARAALEEMERELAEE